MALCFPRSEIAESEIGSGMENPPLAADGERGGGEYVS